MALVKCNECGKEISDTARQCPNCGYIKPPQKLGKLDKIFIPIMILVFIKTKRFIQKGTFNARPYNLFFTIFCSFIQEISCCIS